MQNLYDIDISGVPAHVMCGGNNGGASGTEACPVLTSLPGIPGGYQLADTKRPDLAGLRFNGDEMRKLANGLNELLAALG